jgi:hypothetical protein
LIMEPSLQTIKTLHFTTPGDILLMSMICKNLISN